MANYQISNLLDELQSNEAYIRSDAIKKILKGKITHEHIIAALDNIIENDPSPTIRNFAQSTLDTFGIKHSINERPRVIRSTSSSHKRPQPTKSDAVQLTTNLATPTKSYSPPSTITLEKTIFDNRVEITSEKAIFGTNVGDQIYLIADITAASLIQPPFPIITAILAPITILAGCLIIGSSFVFSINFDLAGFSIFGLLLIGMAIYFISPTYTVEIVTSSEKTKVFGSKNFDKCKTIVVTLNKVISSKEIASTSIQSPISEPNPRPPSTSNASH
jgi:hypothetical protein